MGPASGHSGTGCSPKSLRALAPRLTRHRAGLWGDLLLSPAVWMSWSPVSLACLCLNDAEGAVGWTAFLSLIGAKETLCLDNELSNSIMQRLSALQPELLASILKTG